MDPLLDIPEIRVAFATLRINELHSCTAEARDICRTELIAEIRYALARQIMGHGPGPTVWTDKTNVTWFDGVRDAAKLIDPKGAGE